MADKQALQNAMNKAYESYLSATAEMEKLNEQVAEQTKTLDDFKRKLEAVRKQIKAAQSAVGQLRKDLDALDKVVNKDVSDKSPEREIGGKFLVVLGDAHDNMKKVLDKAEKDVK